MSQDSSEHRLYYGPGGQAISREDWERMFVERGEDMTPNSWWRRQTQVDDEVDVSTVWLGLDHNFGDDGPPLIWETMVFGGEHDGEQWRYPSRESALANHERIVAALRAGEHPN